MGLEDAVFATESSESAEKAVLDLFSSLCPQIDMEKFSFVPFLGKFSWRQEKNRLMYSQVVYADDSVSRQKLNRLDAVQYETKAGQGQIGIVLGIFAIRRKTSRDSCLTRERYYAGEVS